MEIRRDGMVDRETTPPGTFNCYLLVFDSTHQALRGEEELKRSRVPHEVTNTPPHIKADCGISLRVRPGDRGRARGVLDAAGVIYSRVEPYYCRWLDDPDCERKPEA